MSFKLPDLPYGMDQLSPHLSKETLEFHYGKHHKAYVDKLNQLTEGKPQANMSLEEVIMTSEGGIFNNAAQIWNHTFYWNGFKPGAGGEPKGAMLEAINKSFGSFEKFKADFADKAVTQFGSGWAWLVKKADGSLAVTQTSNADLPMKHGQKALLTCDVWEHAYYIDYRNLRPKYVEGFWNLVNWDFVQKNLEQK